MICPHCLVAIKVSTTDKLIGSAKGLKWWVTTRNCPNCENLIIHLNNGEALPAQYGVRVMSLNEERLVWPKAVSRKPLQECVPEKYACDYKEACLVLADSAKASAALSRRCLQNILLNEEGVKKGNLSDQIQEVLDRQKYPIDLAESVDAVRNLGNFAAHPLKDTVSGEIIEVEPGEAEWNLDVLEMLFDYYFVQPSIRRAKRDALNEKLARAGKPQMK